jgi:hypothetical protein
MKKVLIFSICIFTLIISTNTLNASGDSPDEGITQGDLSIYPKDLATDDPVEIPPENDTKIRWSEDKIIYDGLVNVNSWLVATGVDDDAIDVDYFAGDTLRAVVACPDSTVRIFKTVDNGQTWSQAASYFFSNGAASEPHIVHGPDSTYHVFCIYVRDENDIHTQARRTSDESVISGTNKFLSGDDSVKNYSVCTNRQSSHDYSVFLAYHKGMGGVGGDQIYFTKTTDRGQNWTTPSLIRSGGSGFPDITYGEDEILYIAYLHKDGINDMIGLRRSINWGENWQGSVFIEEDTYPKMGPQIAAAYDGSGNVWLIWPRKDLLTPNEDWGLRWSWSNDLAANWSSPLWINSNVDSNEVLPSIATDDSYESDDNIPNVTFIKSYHDWTGEISVRSFYWQTSDSSWSADSCYADSGAVVTRPVQTYIAGAIPAIAYVGRGAEKVYFDSWTNFSGIEEDNDIAVSDGQIDCSLDRNVILGTAALKYTLPQKTIIDISLVNVLGQKVASLDNGEKESGEHNINVSAENLSQGIYYIVIETANGQKGIAKAAVLK